MFVSFLEEEKPERQEKIVNTYKIVKLLLKLSIKYTENTKEKHVLNRLVFITEKEKESSKIEALLQEDKIELIKSKESEPEFLLQFNKIISNVLREFIKLFKIEISRLEKEEAIEKKNKNLLNIYNRAEYYLLLGEYKVASQTFTTLFDLANKSYDSSVMIKSKAGLGVCLFVEDFIQIYREDNQSNIKELKFNPDVESCFEYAILQYKKSKSIELTIEVLFKLACYYILFDSRIRQFLDIMKRIYDEAESLNTYLKLSCLLKIKNLYDSMNMKRKSVFFLYMALGICFENADLVNMIPYIFKEISPKLFIYDIYNDKIENPSEFTDVHKRLLKSNWKKISFNFAGVNEDKKEMKETNKKRIDKEFKLYVLNRTDPIKKYVLNHVWEPVQYNMYLNLLNFFGNVNDLKMKLSYGMSFLQTLSNFMPISEQTNLATAIMMDSGLLQEKIFLNFCKFPVLMKIIPLASEVKFDTIKSSFIASPVKNPVDKNKDMMISNSEEEKVNTEQAQSPVFLYNPWDRDESINYYWTENSYQKVYIQFYNPLSFELRINKIVLIFEGNKPFSFPTSTILQPNSIQGVTCKLRPLQRGITNIMGIKYEIFNTGSVQFVDWNGNGLYYGYDNYSNDSLSLSNNKKEKINLRNIKISPEIPQLEIKILDSSSKIINGSLDLFDYQFYNFSFLLENTGESSINELSVNIYAYKKDDYKISLGEIKFKNEILIEKGKPYTLNYKYLHKKIYKKIEFKIYYNNEKNNQTLDVVIIKPYLYYIKPLKTLKLLNLSNLKVIPMLSNNMIHLITLSDPKINKDYSKFFCSDKYYVSFVIGNSHEDTINLDIYSKQNLIKKEKCESKNTKEISLVIDSEMRMSEFSIQWEFDQLNNVKGKIDLSQIFKEFSFKLKNTIKFEINSTEEKTEEGVKYFSVEYKLKNNIERTFKNLKFYIYLYQVHDDDNIVFNNQLPDDICYEGSLFYQIRDFKGLDVLNFELKLFPLKNEHLSTTCLVVDSSNQIVYMSPISKSFYLKY